MRDKQEKKAAVNRNNPDTEGNFYTSYASKIKDLNQPTKLRG